jgi:hypothetical protein
MVGPRLSNSFASEQSTGDACEAPISDYLETIAILQAEVARLEQELQFHNERQSEAPLYDEASFPDETEAARGLENVGGEPDQVAPFEAELVSRDETIRLLLDELSRVEEAQAATQSEWEHLAGWVTELEHRVEGQDREALLQFENRLAGEQQKVSALQVKSEQDRGAWEAQRRIYQEEITRLQEALDQIAKNAEAPGTNEGRVTQGREADDNVVEALQAENLRLRAGWEELVERRAAADRSEALEAKLAETVNEHHQLRRQLEQIEDERKRERLLYEANAAELQARLSQASLTQPHEPTLEKGPERVSAERDIELRVRALRQHLLEVDQREKEERRQKQLINRLSRLWTRTGPR